MSQPFNKYTVLALSLGLVCFSSLVNADSTNSSLLPTTKTVVTPQVRMPYTTTPDNFGIGDYASLPACPTDPVCRDINGLPPPGKTAAQINCPSPCTVTRSATTTSGTITTVVTTSTPVASIKPAACPSSYGAIASYNVQPEVECTQTAQTLTNVTQAQYSGLPSNASCSASQTTLTSNVAFICSIYTGSMATPCTYTVAAYSSGGKICEAKNGGSITTSLGISAGSIDDGNAMYGGIMPCNGTLSGGCPGGSGTMAYYSVAREGCATGSSTGYGACGGTGVACSLGSIATMRTSAASATCTIPAGCHSTGDNTPVSLVCAPLTHQWSTQQP